MRIPLARFARSLDRRGPARTGRWAQRRALFWVALFGLPAVAWGATVTVPYLFVNGGPADATEVNTNFSALVGATNSHDSRIGLLESTLFNLQGQAGSNSAGVSSLQSTFNGVSRAGSDLVGS